MCLQGFRFHVPKGLGPPRVWVPPDQMGSDFPFHLHVPSPKEATWPGAPGARWEFPEGRPGWAGDRALPLFLLPVPQVSVEQLSPHCHPKFKWR